MLLMTDLRMLMVVPCMLWSSFSCSVYSNIFISVMDKAMENSLEMDPEYKYKLFRDYTALLSMIGLGVGEIFGG